MAEEHGFQASEGHRLCANNCGFFGSPTTQNFCSKCYRDLCLKKESKANSVADSLFSFPSSSAVTPSLHPATISLESTPATVDAVTPEEPAVQLVAQPNRCSVCRKKVGLTGFRCRCGTTFCGTHRYPEQHGCSFDFKSMGREAIAKANPVVKADKLEKI
ncbi:hypothetical protein M9H77_24105 [Catharanthus roseus]|uniref:Uncharacterized protein n=1 Tax=Catharanthus roseus TaxID=4058 RepID=A0ACC0AUT2_CATRO|nr:hypothetical protein M9H77_24105 [Catharanthus roseus]